MKCLKLAICVFVLCLFLACDDSLDIEKNPVISKVSLIGDAARGWEDFYKNPLPLFMERTGEDVFEFRGSLSAGFLKISADAVPNWDGCWFLPSADTVLNNGLAQSMVYSIKGDGGENGPKWEISKPALYNITLNKKTKTIQCTEEGEYVPEGTNEIFSSMYFVLCRQDAPQSYPMTKTGDNWVITRNLSVGNYIKFNGENLPRIEWEVPFPSLKWFCPLADGTPVSGTAIFKYGADNSFAWRVNTQGSYTVTLNPREGTVSFE